MEQCQAQLEQIVQDIDALVRIESNSYDKEGLNKALGFIESLFTQRLGKPTTSERHDCGERGDTLVLTYQGTLPGAVTLIGHYDTVWPTGTLAGWDSFGSVDESGREKISGPGIFDMKTGLIQGMWALKLLMEQRRDYPTVHFVINGDEELGSNASRAVIEQQALASDAVFVLEASADGKVKVARKGVAIIEVSAQGVEAHAGLEPAKGASAITALMEYCLAATKLADVEKETTLNVGLINGGSGSNVVAGKAAAAIDIRYWDPSEKDRLNAAFDELKWTDSRATVSTKRDWNRPPMVFTEPSQKLFAVLESVAADMGRELGKVEVGGASDANFVSALGVPVICGLGAAGAGAHARYEFIYPDQIPFFTALVAEAITKIVPMK